MVSTELFAHIDDLENAILPQVACRPDELRALVEQAVIDDCVDILDVETGQVSRFASLPGHRKASIACSNNPTSWDFDVFKMGNGWDDLELSESLVACPPHEDRAWCKFTESATSCEGGGEGRYKVNVRQIAALLDRFGLHVTLPVQENMEHGRNPRGAGAKPFPYKGECEDALFLKLVEEGDDARPDAAYEDFVANWYEERGQKPPQKTTAGQIIQGARERWQKQDGLRALPLKR